MAGWIVTTPRRVVPVVAAILLATAPVVLAQSLDIVEFKGGNRLLGEIKRLERGRLYFDSTATDTIAIDWSEVTQLVTARRLRVEDVNGDRQLGSLSEARIAGSLTVTAEHGTVDVPLASIVNIDPIEQTAWERTDLEVSAGYSLTKATGMRQWNVAVDLEHETERRSRALALSSQSTGSDEEDDSLRHVLDGEMFVLHRALWLSGWLLGAERNDALDLDRRAVVAYGGGRRFFPRASQRGLLFGGLQVNQERFSETGSQSSLESVFYGKFDWYRFKEPELDLSTALTVLPSVTEFGRIRARFDISLKWEFYRDVFWQLTFYNDYDSDPRSSDGNDEAPATKDYGITTGIGWSH